MSEKRKLKTPKLRRPVRLHVEVEQVRDLVQVTLVGPVDSETLQHFDDCMKPLCKRSAARMLIDCSKLRYMNSRGIGVLMKYYDQLTKRGGRLAVCKLNTKVVRTFDLLGVGKRIPRYASAEEAMAYLAVGDS